jgi:photosystem II stability/assembly factor-like uncharacterized protein
MSDRLLLGTRKGLFDLRRRSGTWRIANSTFLGQPVSMLLADPRDKTLYAALALGHFGVHLHRSTDDGQSWQEIAAPAFAKVADEEANDNKDKAPSVSLIWALEPSNEQPGTLWAGTIPGGLFQSKDRGDSWSLVESLWNLPERAKWGGGGYDHPGIHSVCVDPHNPRNVALAVSTGGVWLSDDAGASWRLGGPGMYAEYMPPEGRDDPLMQDVHRILQSPSNPEVLWVQHHNGVFRSTNRAESWQEITAIKPAKFGFALAVHPSDADTAWFVPAIKDENRIPVGGALTVARTTDGGRSFTELRDGLPQKDAYDLIYRHGLAVDESGQRLAMGSTTGHLWVSENAGDNWALIGGNLPPIACVQFA